MPIKVLCPRCGEEAIYDEKAGSYFCDKDGIHLRGPSKYEAKGKESVKGVQHPRRQ